MRARLLGTVLIGVGCYSGAPSPEAASEGSTSTGGGTTTTTSTTTTTAGVTEGSEGSSAGATTGAGSSSTGGVVASTGSTGASTGMIPDLPPPPAPGVHYVGRFDASDPTHVRMGWSGVGLVVRFNGTGASVTLDDKARYFTVVVDGAVQPPLATTPGEQSYPLATGLAVGEHVVELYRRTEGSFGPTVVVGVQVEGELLPPPAVSRRIEVIGDSITCGYGNEGVSPCDFSAETENHYRTYGAIAARALGAEIHTVAWSGKGVVYNFGDDKNEPLPTVYDRILAASGDPWDFSWQPDAVVINLGTNDFSTSDDPPEGLFVPAYVEFLAHLRSVYPQAYILAVAPSLFGTDATKAEGYIQSAVAQRAAEGDAAVGYADVNVMWLGSGCDGHPDAATHEAMGARLEEELKARLGW